MIQIFTISNYIILEHIPLIRVLKCALTKKSLDIYFAALVSNPHFYETYLNNRSIKKCFYNYSSRID